MELFIRPDGRFDDLDRSGELVLSVGLHNWRGFHHFVAGSLLQICLLYTSAAADE